MTTDVYFRVQTNIHAFCKSDDIATDPDARASDLLQDLEGDDFLDRTGDERPRFRAMIEQHRQRLQNKISLTDWKNDATRVPPIVRFNLQLVRLQPEDLAFLQAVLDYNRTTATSIQEVVDTWYSNEYQKYVSLEGHIRSLWTNGNKTDSIQLPPSIFRTQQLVELDCLCVTGFMPSESHLDLGGLPTSMYGSSSDKPRRVMRKLIVQCAKHVKQLTLSGAPQELQILFLSQLETIDIREMDLSQLTNSTIKGAKPKYTVICTDGQWKAYPEALRKIRGKKDKRKSSAEELDRLRDERRDDTTFQTWVALALKTASHPGRK